MEGREIPTEDYEILRTALGSKTEGVPASVVKRYWRVKRCYDRMNLSMNSHTFILGLIAGWDEESKESPTPQVVSTEWDKVDRDSLVKVWWRNKDCKADFKGVKNDGSLLVQIHGQSEVREISAEKVELLLEELAAV